MRYFEIRPPFDPLSNKIVTPITHKDAHLAKKNALQLGEELNSSNRLKKGNNNKVMHFSDRDLKPHQH